MKTNRWLTIGIVVLMSMFWHSPAHAAFVDNGNGTVSDTSTGLMWQQDTARDTEGNYDPMTWEEALAYCESRTIGGHTDWRLPTIKELRSLVDYTQYDPAIDKVRFPNTVSSYYWSSTTYASIPTTPGSSISTMASTTGTVSPTTITFGRCVADSLGHLAIWIILSFRPFPPPRPWACCLM